MVGVRNDDDAENCCTVDGSEPEVSDMLYVPAVALRKPSNCTAIPLILLNRRVDVRKQWKVTLKCKLRLVTLRLRDMVAVVSFG